MAPAGGRAAVGAPPETRSSLCYHAAARAASGATLLEMPNIKQQEKRVRSASRERDENLRYRSTIKTLQKRLANAVADGDAEKTAADHRELVKTIDRAAARGAIHRNTAARKKSQAARLVASTES